VTLGQLIKQYRDAARMSLADVSERMESAGFSITPQGLGKWENRKPAKDDTFWNPTLITALADAFDKTELEILTDLGFDLLPEGFTAQDVKLALAIRPLPDTKKMQLMRAFNAILDLFEDEG